MDQKKYKVNKSVSKAAEPDLPYTPAESGNELRFFTSFQEMNEADEKEMSLMSPEENLRNATLLIKQVFAKELKEKFSGYTIHFKFYGNSNS